MAILPAIIHVPVPRSAVPGREGASGLKARLIVARSAGEIGIQSTGQRLIISSPVRKGVGWETGGPAPHASLSGVHLRGNGGGGKRGEGRRGLRPKPLPPPLSLYLAVARIRLFIITERDSTSEGVRGGGGFTPLYPIPVSSPAYLLRGLSHRKTERQD